MSSDPRMDYMDYGGGLTIKRQTMARNGC